MRVYDSSLVLKRKYLSRKNRIGFKRKTFLFSLDKSQYSSFLKLSVLEARIRTQQGNVTICLSEKLELSVSLRLSVIDYTLSFFSSFYPTATSSLIHKQKLKRRLRDEMDLKLNYGPIWTQTKHYIGLGVAYLQRLHEKVAFVTLHANYRLVLVLVFKKKPLHLVFHVALINR